MAVIINRTPTRDAGRKGFETSCNGVLRIGDLRCFRHNRGRSAGSNTSSCTPRQLSPKRNYCRNPHCDNSAITSANSELVILFHVCFTPREHKIDGHPKRRMVVRDGRRRIVVSIVVGLSGFDPAKHLCKLLLIECHVTRRNNRMLSCNARSSISTAVLCAISV